MNIVFANTYFQKRVAYTSLISVIPPLDLAYCAAYVRREIREINVYIIDANAMRLNENELVKRIGLVSPDIVVFSAPTYAINTVSSISGNLSKDIKQILIGTHGSALPQETLTMCSRLDYVILGEPEYVLLNLIESIMGNRPPESVEGIAFRENTTIKIQDNKKEVDIDSLPYPARDLLPNHLYSSPFSAHVTAIQTTRGCPGKCTFCDSRLLFGSHVRKRSPEKIVNEMIECFEKYKTTYFAIMDHTFTVDNDFVRDVCDKIIEHKLHKKIRWVCNTRVDVLHEKLVRKMKEAGCLQIGIGIESAIDSALDAVRKDITLREIKEAIDNIKKNGIIAMGYSIIGFPEDSPQTIKETNESIKRLDPHTIQIAFATPLPGTELYEKCKKEDRILSHNWNHYVFLNKAIIKNDTLSTEELIRMRRALIRSFYFRPWKIIKLVFFMLFRAKVNMWYVTSSACRIFTTLLIR